MKEQKKNKTIEINFVLIVAIVTTIIVLVLSIAKYTSTLAKENATEIATPILTYSTTDTIEISISPTDEEKTYIFAVSNYEEEEITEVNMSYYIQINSEANLPLEVELYTYENETIGTTNLLEKNGTTTDDISISLGEKETHTYALKIRWQEGATSYKYAKEVDYIEVAIHAEQDD